MLCIVFHPADVNECLSSPCQNNATCHDGINELNCHCIPGYTGPLCGGMIVNPSCNSKYIMQINAFKSKPK